MISFSKYNLTVYMWNGAISFLRNDKMCLFHWFFINFEQNLLKIWPFKQNFTLKNGAIMNYVLFQKLKMSGNGAKPFTYLNRTPECASVT